MKKILFVCIENSCRSQIAEGFARQLGVGIIEAFSAGSKPSGKVNSMAIEVMREAGIDISGNVSKGFNELPVKDFDYAVTLGCQDICPFVTASKHIEWQIEDPKGRDISFFKKIRDDIKSKVKGLVDTLSLDN